LTSLLIGSRLILKKVALFLLLRLFINLTSTKFPEKSLISLGVTLIFLNRLYSSTKFLVTDPYHQFILAGVKMWYNRSAYQKMIPLLFLN
ncbi:hypothetical protein ACFLWT_02470, partial [Chloroflexota bacterium]